MTVFSLGFGSSSVYNGGGNQIPINFWEHWPPEAGCIGYTVDDDAIAVKGVITNQAREYLARSVSDGTSIKMVEFSVGSGGYNVAMPVYATDPDPASLELESEIYRATLTATENVTINGMSKSFVGRLSMSSVVGGIGEIGLWAEILSSPYPTEIGSKFLFAICHQPLNVKSLNHVASYRIIVVF